MDKTTGMNEIIESSGIEDDDNKQLLGGINIISIDPTNQAAAAVEMMVAIENEVELLEDLKEDWTYDDDDEIDNEWMDDDDDNEEEDEKDREVDQSNTLTTAMLGQVAVIETLIGQVTPEMFDNILDEVNIEISEDNVGINDEGSVVTLSLRKNGDDDDDEDDEDEQDHFPTNIGKDDNEDGEEDDEDQQGKKTDTKEEKHVNPPNNIPSNSIDGKTNQGNGNVTKDIDNHKHGHQDQNANLGGTGGNGPILLCSSKSCLPSLRDSILSKIAVQIHQVMDHLRSRNILVHRMSLTAPQTKESLMAGQEELVQQLEDRINNDLREWVNGFRHKFKLTDGGTGKVATTDASSMVINTQTISDDAEVSAETESLFPIEDEFEEETQGDRPDDSFYMTSLSLEDADDDDEDHEDDPFIRKHTFHPVTGSTATTTTKNKARPKKSTKKAAKSKVHKRDMSSSSIGNDATKSHEYFLSADKLLMRQEWSRWIAHWVHHTKLLILSHTLEPQTLTEMNQIAIAGENVVSADQRHWSWNLDKALATVMVASEMICGGPTSAKDVKVFISTLSTSSDSIEATSVNIGDKFPDIMSPKALAITLNAQKCIEAWSQDLEDILQRTATTA
ncbi:hypothetical protein FBU30_009132 [Linnemannia zychae]|nr:hypothetical protein FBU30_009132 [Linnemannia zychae]